MRVLVAATIVPGLWAMAASLGATFVLAYSFNGQLIGRERAWPSITVPLLLAASWYVLLLSQLAARQVGGVDTAPRRRRLVGAVAAISLPALALLGLSAIDLIRDEHALITTTIRRSVAWDKQQAALEQKIAAGARSLVVRPLPIDGLYEPFYPNSRSAWPSMCAPAFYGVDQVVRPPRARP